MTLFKDIFKDWPDEVKKCLDPTSEFYNEEVFNNLLKISKLYDTGPDLYAPDKDKVFRAFKETSFSDVRVVLIGQDPYHSIRRKEKVATGLCFGVNPESKYMPPSLRIILNTLPPNVFRTVDLQDWARQGVLMLNTALSVKLHNPNSHSNYWKEFTNLILTTLNKHKENLVFVMWGREAQKYLPLIDMNKHNCVLDSHPMTSIYKPQTPFTGKFDEINSFLTDKIIF